MEIELLLWILYCVLIVAGLFLIAVLWRTFEVLSNFKETSSIVLKRTKELDESITKVEFSFLNLLEGIKKFIYSLEFVKKIRNTLEDK